MGYFFFDCFWWEFVTDVVCITIYRQNPNFQIFFWYLFSTWFWFSSVYFRESLVYIKISWVVLCCFFQLRMINCVKRFAKLARMTWFMWNLAFYTKAIHIMSLPNVRSRLNYEHLIMYNLVTLKIIKFSMLDKSNIK